ncbi:energy transducer TonB [Sphingomonas edaphi]|uniref:TonB family protein n=1 Tax=Sphingomonas edaphi TaxID=2315689 RepID=A0A418PZ99_9SPHN|nr:TonB family protein [Sphingomonas edaphi]
MPCTWVSRTYCDWMKFLSSALGVLLICSPALAQAPWSLPESDFGGATPLNRRDWIKPTDYPDASARADEQGYVTIAFDIGADGRVSSCKVIRSSAYKRLDAIPCRLLLRRARFGPAKDINGVPVATKGHTSISFWTEG